MNDQKKASRLSRICQLLKTKQNILIVVGENPTVDQLLSGACLASMLRQVPLNNPPKNQQNNKRSDSMKTLSTSESQNRNISVVFKDQIHKGLEFLSIDSFITKSTNSYRDLIVSIKSSKVDKLRYKHLKNEKLVNVIVSPYRNSGGLSKDDLECSQGEINIDAVLTLGVSKLSQLDKEQTPKSLLTDNPVVSLSCNNSPDLFDSFDDHNRESVSWNVKKASCLAGMIYDLSSKLKYRINRELALVFMTALVVATDGFRIDNTSTQTFKIAADIRKLISNKDYQNILAQIEKHELTSSLKMSSVAIKPKIAETADISKPQTTIRKTKIESRQQIKRPLQAIEKLVGADTVDNETVVAAQPAYQQPASPAKQAPQPAMTGSSQPAVAPTPAMAVPISNKVYPEVKSDPVNINHQSPESAPVNINYQSPETEDQTRAPKSAPSLDSIDEQKASLTKQTLPTNNASQALSQSNLYQPNDQQPSKLQKPAQALKQAPSSNSSCFSQNPTNW